MTTTSVAIADDDKSVCRSFGRLLSAAGIHSITYSSAEAFLADLKHPQFGCLLLDIQLDGMSGIDWHSGSQRKEGVPPSFLLPLMLPLTTTLKRAPRLKLPAARLTLEKRIPEMNYPKPSGMLQLDPHDSQQVTDGRPPAISGPDHVNPKYL